MIICRVFVSTERMNNSTLKSLVEKIEGKLGSFKPEQLAVVFYGINMKKYQVGGTLWKKIEEILITHVITFFFLRGGSFIRKRVIREKMRVII